MKDETRLQFARAVTRYQRAHIVNFPVAFRAALPDYLEWTATGWHGATRAARCGGGDPSEAAGFDVFELDEINTPAWAVEAFDGLERDQQKTIIENALEKVLEERE